jgi:hypothetical protein
MYYSILLKLLYKQKLFHIDYTMKMQRCELFEDLNFVFS